MKSLDPIQRKQLEHELRMRKDIDSSSRCSGIKPRSARVYQCSYRTD